MGQPATAAIAVACIFGGLAAIYFGYRVYVKLYKHRHRGAEAELPPVREPLTAYSNGNPGITPSGTLTGTLYGEPLRDSWRGNSSKASIITHFDRSGSQGYGSEHAPISRRASSTMLLASPSAGVMSLEGSAPGSPLSPSGDLSSVSMIPAPADVYDGGAAHGRFSSSSSTMTLKRSYAASTYKGSNGASSPGGLGGPRERRESYLPHLPGNRDSIHITPPQPLGFGLGGMATALDQRTLAFSSASGIGQGTDDFTSGLAWNRTPSDEGNNVGSTVREEERLRYLAQGPGRSHSGSGSGSGSMQSPHPHLYAHSLASGSRTPDGQRPGSRSRSPAQAGWDASSYSDVSSSSPRVTPITHPLEQQQQQQQSSGPQNGLAGPSSHLRYGYNVHQQSPLQRMSDGEDSRFGHHASQNPAGHGGLAPSLHPLDHDRNESHSSAGTMDTAASGAANFSGGNTTAASSETPEQSPIMAAFRNPGGNRLPATSQAGSYSEEQGGRRTPGTPGFASRSGSSATGSGSHSGPSTESNASGGRGSGSQNGDDVTGPASQKSLALGKDGRLHLVQGTPTDKPLHSQLQQSVTGNLHDEEKGGAGVVAAESKGEEKSRFRSLFGR